jgi:hypothetical protein
VDKGGSERENQLKMIKIRAQFSNIYLIYPESHFQLAGDFKKHQF